MRFINQNVKDGISVYFITSIVSGVLAILGKYFLKNFSWESENVTLLTLVVLGIVILFIVAVVLMLRWINSKILLPVLEIKIPKADRTKNPHKRRSLNAKQWAKRKATLSDKIKANRFQIILSLIAIPVFLMLNAMTFLGFLSYLNVREAVFQYNDRISTPPTPDKHDKGKIYWIVYQDISGIGNLSERVYLTKRLAFALEREINLHTLPIRILPQNLANISIDSLAAVSKGVLIVSGFHDDFGTKIKIENKSRMTKSQIFSRTLGIFDLRFYDRFKKVSEDQKIYDAFIENQFNTEFSEEYELQLGVSKELNYFTFKMISEIMISEIMWRERSRNENNLGLELMELIDFAISTLEVSKSHLPYEISFWMTSPMLKPNLNSDDIFSNLSSLFALRASSVKKSAPNQAVEEAALLRAKEDIDKASQYLRVLLAKSPKNYVYNLQEIYYLSVKSRLDMLQNVVYLTEADQAIKMMAASSHRLSGVEKSISAIDTYMITAPDSAIIQIQKILKLFESEKTLNKDAYEIAYSVHKKILINMKCQHDRNDQLNKKLRPFLVPRKKGLPLTLIMPALLTIWNELGEYLKTSDELSSGIEHGQKDIQDVISKIVKELSESKPII